MSPESRSRPWRTLVFGVSTLSVAAAMSIVRDLPAAPPRHEEARPANPASAHGTADDLAALQKLEIMFGVDGVARQTMQAAAGDRTTLYRAFTRSAMAKSSFYDVVFPRLISGFAMSPIAFPFVLDTAKVGGKDVYWIPGLAKKPCELRDAVPVKPWWDPSRPVLICKDAYAPEVTTDARSNGIQYCDSTYNQNPGQTACRCGSYLINCARNFDQSQRVTSAIQDEAIRTAQYVVQNKRPFSELLTMNETMRSDLANFIYERAQYLETGRAEFTADRGASQSRLRPRDPRFSGVLTAPQYRWSDPAPRLLLGYIFEDYLCLPMVSSNVDGHVLMKMSNSSLRSKEHLELTEMTGCRDCHARLEYALRPYRGFTMIRDGWRFAPIENPNLTTKFFMWNSSDLRAEGPATPRWIGEQIGKQPEFSSCLVERVTRFVFRGAPVRPAVRARLVAKFQTSQDFSELVEDVVQARFGGEDARASLSTQ